MLISQYWEPEEGVIQRRLAWLTGDITAQGHTISVITPPPHYPGGVLITDEARCQPGSVDDSAEGITVFRTKFREHDKSIVSRVKDQATIMVSQLATARKAFTTARQSGKPIDAVTCTVPALPSAIVAFILAKTHRLPLVIELRDAWPEILEYMDQWSDPHRGKISWYRRAKISVFHFFLWTCGRVLDWVLKQADLVITTTATLAEKERKKGCKKVVSVRNRANSGMPNCNAYPSRGSGPLRVLYAGTVGRAQGLTNAVKATAIAKERGFPVELRIIGGGAHLNLTQKLAQKLGVDVDFVGRVSFRDIVPHYQWADTALVHLESWAPMELTIPSKLFEIMWAEKHVSAAVAGEAADIVRDSGIGDVVPPMDPEALADLWEELYHDRSRLEVDGRGEAWFRSGPTLETLTQRWIDSVQEVVDK